MLLTRRDMYEVTCANHVLAVRVANFANTSHYIEQLVAGMGVCFRSCTCTKLHYPKAHMLPTTSITAS
jgi:hypothetical protein